MREYIKDVAARLGCEPQDVRITMNSIPLNMVMWVDVDDKSACVVEHYEPICLDVARVVVESGAVTGCLLRGDLDVFCARS